MPLRKLRSCTSSNTSTGGKLLSERHIGWNHSWEGGGATGVCETYTTPSTSTSTAARHRTTLLKTLGAMFATTLQHWTEVHVMFYQRKEANEGS